ncbi:O-antigen ligase family protein [Catelliglobosispora koreensis]|uniref:O-antigen ligase family protein n=1 Tax=Catelliglobosispora koreensis TaxID=129052 RepID=UPI0012F8ED1C|nr:O-antigen ligase family protein [Catelliglobosispora koreensis]
MAEGWLVTIFGSSHFNAGTQKTVIDEAGWPKTLKSVIYFALFGVTVAKLTIDRSWGMLRSKVDIALAVLALVLIAAGLAGGSSATLIGQALFVYFRGAIVFYAWRALKPSWEQARPLFWLGGGLVVLNVLAALWQFLAGRSAYTAVGWPNLQWADEGRAQGFLPHPNDLGHVTGLMVLGLAAWMLSRENMKRRWWALFVLIAAGLSVASSKHSLLAAVAGLGVIAVLRRGRFKRAIALGLIVAVIGGAPMAFSPEVRYQLSYRFEGLFNALGIKWGKPQTSNDQEIRILYAKQGAKLWAASPVLGYGVGQFGGIVAVKADPAWNEDPRFVEVLGGKGFDKLNFEATSVDMFWLHLLVEAGALGILAYLVWLGLMVAPLVRSAWRDRGGTFPLWAAGTVIFAVVIAAWSPSLEDPLFPPLMFSVLGFGWALLSSAGTIGAVASEGREVDRT